TRARSVPCAKRNPGVLRRYGRWGRDPPSLVGPPTTALGGLPLLESPRAGAWPAAPRRADPRAGSRGWLPPVGTEGPRLCRHTGGGTAVEYGVPDGRPWPRRSAGRGRRARYRSTAPRHTGPLPRSVVLGAHYLAMHYSGIVSWPNLLGEQFLLSFLWVHLKQLPPV